jgi:heat shock protein HtpX
MTEPAKLGLTTYRLNNNIKSVLLLVAFPLLLLLLLGVIFFVFGLFSLGNGGGYYDPFDRLGLPHVLGIGNALDLALSAVYAWWPSVLGIAAIWTLIGYLFNDAIIHAATGARPVTRQEQPELYNLIENLCISRGLTVPRLYIIDTDVMNAYASGIDDKSYSITVTRGLLERLNNKEMEAVLAHELTHIIDRDTRVLIVTIVFTGMISFLAQMLWRSLQVASYGRRSRERDGGGAVIIIMLISAVAMAIGYMLALVLRFAISRRREFMADAGSVELTKNPEALISALRKISANPDVPHVPTEVRQMFIENPPSAFDIGGLFATHPPIEARIKVLEELGGIAPQETSGIVPSVHSTSPAPAQAADAPKSDPWQGPPHKSPWDS